MLVLGVPFDSACRCWLRRGSVAALAAIVLTGPLVAMASAQSWFSPWGNSWERGPSRGYWERAPRRGYREWGRRKRSAHRRQRVAPHREEITVETPNGPVLAIVSLENQRIHVYSADGLIAHSPVSTGAKGYRTPTGVFSVIQKRRYHESNIYSGAPMPWMQRLTWSGIALHGGVVPGYPASHGCIRLTYSFAPKMWAMTKLGARIIVTRDEVAPVDIAHPRLPVPHMTPAPNEIVTSHQGERPVTIEASIAVEAGDQRVTMTDKDPATGTLAIAAPRLEGPLDRARAARAQARADASAAARAVKPALVRARHKSQGARRARATLHRATARARAAAARAVAAVRTQDGAISAAEAEDAAREALNTAQKALAEATAAEAAASAAAVATAESAKAALKGKAQTAAALKSWANGLDPISVFVSRKEGRIYVRQGFAPLLNAPVTIRDVERPLGTHVFTAVAKENAAVDLRWTVVTVADEGADFALVAAHKKRSRRRSAEIKATPLEPGTASEALDRIDIPEEISKEIADRLWAGASLVISDQGRGSETGRGTDFVVLTR